MRFILARLPDLIMKGEDRLSETAKKIYNEYYRIHLNNFIKDPILRNVGRFWERGFKKFHVL